MYFVDRQKIEHYLEFLEKNMKLYQNIEQWEQEISILALERVTQSMIDCVLDISNAMIDGFIMRDPGSYDDIIDILLDEKVITKEMEEQFKRILPLRKMIVQDYLEIDHQQLQKVLNENFQAFIQFPSSIRLYLMNELGPVSAFIN